MGALCGRRAYAALVQRPLLQEVRRPMSARTASIRRGSAGILLLVSLLLAACSSGSPATPTPLASLPPEASASPSVSAGGTTPSGNQVYTVTAEGRSVAVQHFSDVSYARITVSNMAHLSVGTAQPVSTFSISPKRLNVAATKDGSNLRFSLPSPISVIVTVNSLEKLFLFVDPVEANPPSAKGSGVVNLSSYAQPNGGSTLQTTQIQSAIDAASALNGGSGGVLFVPDGDYTTGTLQLKRNVAMYLQSGARLHGSGNPSDYANGAFIQARSADNAHIFGRGMIDGNGTQVRPAGAHVKLLQVVGGSNIAIDDVLLRDSASWTVHINGASNVAVNNVRIINDQSLSNGDGIDPDGSTGVTVRGAFIYTTDDCFALKTTGGNGVTQALSHVMIERSVCWTKKSALKVGTETKSPISDITFSNDDVVHADRALALYMADGSSISDVRYLDDRSEVIGGDAKQRLIEFEITKRGGAGTISNVTITNYVADDFSPSQSSVKGYDASHAVTGVSFKNLTIAGTVRLDAASAQIASRNATGITFSP
jgi:hypothetical protein